MSSASLLSSLCLLVLCGIVLGSGSPESMKIEKSAIRGAARSPYPGSFLSKVKIPPMPQQKYTL
jgi:hypothetical protein